MTTKLHCIQCGQEFYIPAGEAPITTLDGCVCSNICLTNWFHRRVSETEKPFKALSNTPPIRRRL